MKHTLFFTSALVFAGALTVYALPQCPDKILSVTRSFSLDGRWYSVGEQVNVDSVIRKELGKRGNDISRIPGEIFKMGGFLVDALSEIPPNTRIRSIPLLSRVHAEHSLQMESRKGFIDISSGKVYGQGDSFRKGLADSGWNIVETTKGGKPVHIATFRNEKETSIVFLEEREGTCLLLRHLER